MMKSNKQASRLGKASLLASLTIAALSATSSVQAKTINVETNNLFSQFFANIRCKRAAIKYNGEWTGRYWLKPGSLDGYCQVVVPDPVVKKPPPRSRFISVNADRLWSQGHANSLCPKLASERGGRWTGKWSDRTATAPSYCQVELKPAPPKLAPPKPPKLAPIKPEIRRDHRSRRNRSNTREVSAGFIRDQSHANRKCPQIARQTNGTWEGEWRTTKSNSDAVCKIKYASVRHSKRNIREVDAGYIWDANQANTKCPLYAAQNNARWTGKWRKVSTNNRAVCEVEFGTAQVLPVVTAAPTTYVDLTSQAPARNTREIAAGPIWDANQAKTKCPYIASNNNGTWTGNWRKTGPNHASLCEVRF